MRYEEPKTRSGANGIYGGIGSKPGHEPWTPGGRRRRAGREWVPARFRRLRIRRRHALTTDRDRRTIWPILVVLAFVAFLVLLRLEVVSL